MEKIEEFMPKMVLRVLVVEPDDCTRQILTALLRKCDYKVAAVGDGLQAWEFLKKWHSSVDLILTELDLPSVSGYALLSLVTEHENCKHIPVVVASSEDSISMVLKCMMKGAVDFLLKPVRKNELKNLWRHVWRRLAVNGPRNLATQQLNNATSIHSDDNVSTSRKSVEETKYNPSNVKVENELTVLAGCADGKLANPDLGCRYNNEDKVSVSVREDENTSCTGLTTEYQPSEESEHCRGQGAMDLIGTGSINNSKSIVSQTSTDLVFNSLNHSTLDLQLSLTSFHDSETKAIDESQNLNHSNSSAFSWYNDSNNTQTAGTNQAAKSLNSAFHSDDSPLLTCSSVYSDSINHSSTVNRESLERGGSNSSQIIDPSRSTNAVEKAVKDETFNFRELDQFRRRTSNHSAEREAALARFRMKRQGRCFEKKVRYQSRKKQAEQRPRVKGQFVRRSPY